MKTSGGLILLATLILWPVDNHGQMTSIVDWGAQIDNGLGTADGTELPAGDLVRIGTFKDLTDAQIQSAQFSFATLNLSFVEYDTAVIGEGADGIAAYWAKATTKSTGAPLNLNGQQIYLWAFNAPTTGPQPSRGYLRQRVGCFRPIHSPLRPRTLIWTRCH